MMTELYLRPLTYEDAELIVNWRNQVRKNYIRRDLLTIGTQKKYYKHFIETGKVIQFVLCNKDVPVGCVVLSNIDYKKQEAESGIFMGGVECAGKGYGKAGLKLLVEMAFRMLGFQRLYARVFTDNVPSIKTHLSAGYIKTGKIKVICSDGEEKQMYVFEILKSQTESEIVT